MLWDLWSYFQYPKRRIEGQHHNSKKHNNVCVNPSEQWSLTAEEQRLR